MDPRAATLALAACTVDLVREVVCTADGTERALTTREAALLAYLAARPGQDVCRQTLLREVWGYGDQVISRAADSTMKRLRDKVEADPAQPRHLLTVFGHGYRFVPLGAAARWEGDASRLASQPAHREVSSPGRRSRHQSSDGSSGSVNASSSAPSAVPPPSVSKRAGSVPAMHTSAAIDSPSRSGSSAQASASHGRQPSSVVVSSDDGVDTWTWDARTLWTTDRSTVGNLADRHRDFKSLALHDVPFTDLLTVHHPSGEWASYHSVGNGPPAWRTYCRVSPFRHIGAATMDSQ